MKIIRTVTVGLISTLCSCTTNNKEAITIPNSLDSMTEFDLRLLDEMKYPLTTIRLDTNHHDFGIVMSGDIVEFEFVVTNTGKDTFQVYNFTTSGGGLVPLEHQRLIPPDSSALFGLKFNTKGKRGKQAKMARIIGNTNPINTKIYVEANVLEH